MATEEIGPSSCDGNDTRVGPDGVRTELEVNRQRLEEDYCRV